MANTLQGSRYVGSSDETSQKTLKGSTFVQKDSTKQSVATQIQQKMANGSIAVKGGYASVSSYRQLSPEDKKRLLDIGVTAFNAEKDAEYKKFITSHVKIGESYISQSDYDSLSATDQARLREIGIAAFNAESKTAYEVFTSTHVQVGKDWIIAEDFEKLSNADQARLRKVGVAAFNAEKQAEYENFVATHISVKDGWVSKEEYDKLSAADQESIKSIGVEAFNASKDAEYKAFLDTHVKVGESYVTKEEYDKLSAADQNRLQTIGIEAFNKENQTEYESFLATHVKVGEGYVTQSEYDKLSAEDKTRLQAIGVDAFNAEKKAEYDKWLSENVAVRGGYVSKEKYDELSPEDQKRLVAVGVDLFNQANEAAYNAYISTHTQVADGWVTNDKYKSLSPEDQKRIVALGTEEFNRQNEAEYNAYIATHTKVADGYIPNEEYNGLSPEDQKRIVEIGTARFNQEKREQAARALSELKSTHVKVADGWVTKEYYDKLTFQQQISLVQLGTVAFNQQQTTQYQQSLATWENKRNTIIVTAMGGELSAPTQEEMKRLGIPAGSTVTFDIDGCTVRRKDGSTYRITAAQIREVKKDYALEKLGPAPTPTPPSKNTGGSSITIVAVGGALEGPSQEALAALDLPPGSTVTVSVDGVEIREPNGDVKTYKPPSETEATSVQISVDKYENDIVNLNYDLLKLNASATATESDYQKLVNRQKELEIRSVELNRQVAEYNVGLSAVPTTPSIQVPGEKKYGILIDTFFGKGTLAYDKMPKGQQNQVADIVQGLWQNFTPWKEYEGETVATHVRQHGYGGLYSDVFESTVKNTWPIVAIGGAAAIPVVGPGLAIGASAALGTYMAVETQKNWGKMNGTEQAFNVIMTGLCFVPITKWGAKSLYNSYRTTNMGKFRLEAETLTRIETETTTALAKRLKATYGEEISDAYIASDRLNGQLLDRILARDQLETREVVGKKAELVKLDRTIESLEKSVKDRWETFVKLVDGKIGFDDPMAAAKFKSANPVSNIREVANIISGKNPVDATILKMDADVAWKALRDTMKKYPNDPLKYNTFMEDAMIKQAKYEMSVLGDGARLTANLAKVQNAIRSGYLENGYRLKPQEIFELEARATAIETALKGLGEGKPVSISNMTKDIKGIEDTGKVSQVRDVVVEKAKTSEISDRPPTMEEWRNNRGKGQLPEEVRQRIQLEADKSTIRESQRSGIDYTEHWNRDRIRIAEEAIEAESKPSVERKTKEIATKVAELEERGKPLETKKEVDYVIRDEVADAIKAATRTKAGRNSLMGTSIDPKMLYAIGVAVTSRTMAIVSPNVEIKTGYEVQPNIELGVGRTEIVTKPTIGNEIGVAPIQEIETGHINRSEIITSSDIKNIVGVGISTSNLVQLRNMINNLPTNATDAEINERLKDIIKQMPQIKQQLKVQSKVDTLTDLAKDVIKYKKVPEKNKTRIHLPDTVTIGEEEISKKDLEGAIAFQQGELMHHGKLEPVVRVFLRGRSEPIVNIGKVKGVPVVSGEGSSYDSLKQFGRGLETSKVRDIGAFHVYVPKNKRGRLVYKRDKVNKKPTIAKMR